MEPDPPAERVRAVDGLLSYPLQTSAITGADLGAPAAEVDEPADATASPSFESFYRDRRDRLARALAMTLGDVHLAAEAADEAMARAYQRWDRVSRFDDPGAWVYRVGLNWATSVLRRRSRAPRPAAEPGPADVAQPSEPDVLAALSELDVRQRAVVVCRFYLGLSEAETAAALGVRPGTVKSRMHRALRTLQPRLSHLRSEESR